MSEGSDKDGRDRRAWTVRGRVQGVGFRWWARRSAQELGLTGWVRNRGDGTVEVEAEGSPADLDAFAEALGRGPTSARVDELVARDPQGPSGGAEFEIRR